MKDDVIRALVREVLAEGPRLRDWTYQGFGMLRTYLDDEERFRLNVWDPGSAIENVSVIHDHPWDFTSLIVCGELVNHTFRYVRSQPPTCRAEDEASLRLKAYRSVEIRTGEGGGPMTEVQPLQLIENPARTVHAPLTYRQHHAQLHWTEATPGTVTINDRELVTGDGPKVATVCWSEGEWVSAEPRPATNDEWEHFVALATKLMP